MDLRVERTYKSLITALTNLMSEKSYDAITVAELCDAAMIRRTTFYKHFADKDEFFAFFVRSLRDEFAQRVGKPEATGPAQYSALLLKQTLSFLTEHEHLVDNALNSASAYVLIDSLEEVIRLDMLQLLEERVDNPEMPAAFISGGIVSMMRQWWAAGCPPELENFMSEVLASKQMLAPA